MAVIKYAETLPGTVVAPATKPAKLLGTPMGPTSGKQKPLGLPVHLNGGKEGTPRSSVAGSPPPEPEDAGTPMPGGDEMNDAEAGDLTGAQPDTELIDRTVPVMPLDQAILTSINFACQQDERKKRDMLGSIMLIGGASKTPNLGQYLEERLRALMPQYPKEILVAPAPREMDPAVMVWKGGSVFGKLTMTNDSWISPLEYDRLGSRILNYKCMWHW